MAKTFKFEIEVLETLSRVVVMEAENEAEALRAVEDQYNNGDITLDANDFVEVKYQNINAENATPDNQWWKCDNADDHPNKKDHYQLRSYDDMAEAGEPVCEHCESDKMEFIGMTKPESYDCETCKDTREVTTMESVYPNEPHQAPIGSSPCPDCCSQEEADFSGASDGDR